MKGQNMTTYWGLGVQHHQFLTPWGTRPHPILCRPSVCVDGDLMFFPTCRRATFLGLLHTWINEQIDQWLWWRSIPVHGDPVREHGGGSLAGDSEGKIKIDTGLFISPSGISELDCSTTKTDTAERSISIGTESLQVFFCTWRTSRFHR